MRDKFDIFHVFEKVCLENYQKKKILMCEIFNVII